jgi:F-type H+-transporting ATPase subunit a
MAAGHDDNPLSHVVDHNTLELPGFREIDLPNILGFQVTRFMVMEVVAATLVILIIVPLTRHIARQRVTRGRFWNLFEAFILFIRDVVARPAIDGAHDEHGHGKPGHDESGHPTHDPYHGPGHDEGGLLGFGPGTSHGIAHKRRDSEAFMPFLWTLFFFILFCNLIGMVPGGASATGNINVTAVLALLTMTAVITAGMRAMGVAGFFVSIVPRMDVPGWLKPPLWGMMFVIELLGLCIRHVVLAVRLFANMLAGHIVLAVILGFILQATGYVTYLVTPASLLGSVAISLLELFVAFLQAYIFTFLAALFIGSAAHPH